MRIDGRLGSARAALCRRHLTEASPAFLLLLIALAIANGLADRMTGYWI
jgi:hypothetical protein